ncbi:MAG TPA: hypothetical protein ENI73_09065, partial [Spirochaetes bacterium]|nr:hypothetical protein [Spirochaetota bacterium]
MPKYNTSKHILILFFLLLVNLVIFRGFFTQNLSESIFPHAGDPCLNAYLLDYDYHKITSLDFHHFFDANIIYPSKKALTFSEHLLGHQIFYIPIRKLSGDPVFSYNLLSLINFLLCSIGLFYLGLYLFKEIAPAVFLAIAFTYSSGLIHQMSHFQIFSFPWLGFVFLFLFLYLETERLKYGLIFVLFWLLQSLGSFYIAYILLLAIFLVILVHIIVKKKYFNLKLWKHLSIIGFLYLIVILPLSLPYLEAKHFYEFKRSIVQNVSFSAHFPISYISPSSYNLFFSFIYDALQDAFPLREMQEKVLFAGFLVFFFFFYRIVQRYRLGKNREKPLEYKYFFWLGLVFFILSLGPIFNRPYWNDKVIIPLPHLIFYYLVPGFSSMRVPARFGLIVIFVMTIIAAYGFKHLIHQLNTRKKKLLVSSLILGLLVLELIPKIPMETVEPIPKAIEYLSDTKIDKNAKIAYYPPSFGKTSLASKYMIYIGGHLKGLINGFSGYYSKSNFYAQILAASINDSHSVQILGRLGIHYLVVIPRFMTNDEKEKLDKALSNKTISIIKTFTDGSRLCRLKDLTPTRDDKLPPISLKWLNRRYLVGFIQSRGDGFYASDRLDTFETLFVEFLGDKGKVLAKTSKDLLIPALIPENNDILFQIKIPDSIQFVNIKKIKLHFKVSDKTIRINREELSSISTLNKPLEDDIRDKVSLSLDVLRTSGTMELLKPRGQLTTLRIKVTNASSKSIPALGKGNIDFSRDDIRIGLGWANSPGKYRTGFLSRWYDEKGKEVLEHDYISWFPFATWLSGDIPPKSTVSSSVLMKVPNQA